MNKRIKLAQDFADEIKSKYIEQIILFGSVARGDDNENSDIDILIITDYRNKIWPKISHLMGETVLNHDELIIAHIMPTQIFNETKNYSFLTNVLEEGIIIG